MKFVFGSLAVLAGLLATGLAVSTPAARAQDAAPLPPLTVGTCFTTLNTSSAQFRVTAIRDGWVRVVSADDNAEPSHEYKVDSRWLNATQLLGVNIISGFRACNFDR